MNKYQDKLLSKLKSGSLFKFPLTCTSLAGFYNENFHDVAHVRVINSSKCLSQRQQQFALSVAFLSRLFAWIWLRRWETAFYCFGEKRSNKVLSVEIDWMNNLISQSIYFHSRDQFTLSWSLIFTMKCPYVEFDSYNEGK